LSPVSIPGLGAFTHPHPHPQFFSASISPRGWPKLTQRVHSHSSRRQRGLVLCFRNTEGATKRTTHALCAKNPALRIRSPDTSD
jgi:hypothetical protein